MSEIKLVKVQRIIQDNNNRYHQPGEKDFGPSLVEPGEVLPLEVQVKRMMLAGERLSQFNANYEFGPDEEIPDDYVDPTRNPGFDMADASRLSREVNEKIEKAKKEQKDASTKTGDKDQASDKSNAESAPGARGDKQEGKG